MVQHMMSALDTPRREAYRSSQASGSGVVAAAEGWLEAKSDSNPEHSKPAAPQPEPEPEPEPETDADSSRSPAGRDSPLALSPAGSAGSSSAPSEPPAATSHAQQRDTQRAELARLAEELLTLGSASADDTLEERAAEAIEKRRRRGKKAQPAEQSSRGAGKQPARRRRKKKRSPRSGRRSDDSSPTWRDLRAQTAVSHDIHPSGAAN